MFDSIDRCRSCDSAALQNVLSLGNVPLADAFVSEAALSQPEARFPLNLIFCDDCSLIQIRETVAPDVLFGSDYSYYASFSPAWLNHCRVNAHEHDHYMPGLRTPISGPERLLTEMPDYVLLLAWNFKDEIIRQQSEYLRRGGQFIIPVPEVRVIGGLSELSAAS